VPVIMNTKEPFEEPTPCTSHLAIHTIPGTWQTGSDRPSVPTLIW
jgi:hypothetical protein